jgi:hypothetical protein
MAQTVPNAANRLTGPRRGLIEQAPGEIFNEGNPLEQFGTTQQTIRRGLLTQIQVTARLLERVNQLEQRVAGLEAQAGITVPAVETPVPSRP